MSNHTPGPWRIEAITAEMRRGRGSARLKDYEFEIEPTKTYPRPDLELWKGQGGPPAFTIARIPIHSGCTGIGTYDGDAEGNARLIAAAPELLEALKKHVCVKAIQGEGMNKVDYYPVEEGDCELCAVIAKVEGKEAARKD